MEMARSEDGLVEAVYMPEAFCVGGAVVSGVFLPHRCEQPEDLLRICCSGPCIKGLTKYHGLARISYFRYLAPPGAPGWLPVEGMGIIDV